MTGPVVKAITNDLRGLEKTDQLYLRDQDTMTNHSFSKQVRSFLAVIIFHAPPEQILLLPSIEIR